MPWLLLFDSWRNSIMLLNYCFSRKYSSKPKEVWSVESTKSSKGHTELMSVIWFIVSYRSATFSLMTDCDAGKHDTLSEHSGNCQLNWFQSSKQSVIHFGMDGLSKKRIWRKMDAHLHKNSHHHNLKNKVSEYTKRLLHHRAHISKYANLCRVYECIS